MLNLCDLTASFMSWLSFPRSDRTTYPGDNHVVTSLTASSLQVSRTHDHRSEFGSFNCCQPSSTRLTYPVLPSIHSSATIREPLQECHNRASTQQNKPRISFPVDYDSSFLTAPGNISSGTQGLAVAYSPSPKQEALPVSTPTFKSSCSRRNRERESKNNNVHPGIGELGVRRGFKGAPLSITANLRAPFLALPKTLSPRSVSSPVSLDDSCINLLSPRSPLESVVNRVRSVSLTMSVNSRPTSKPRVTPNIAKCVQQQYDHANPFDSKGDTFLAPQFLPEIVSVDDLHRLELYQQHSNVKSKTSMVAAVPRKRAMKTTIYDMSIADVAPNCVPVPCEKAKAKKSTRHRSRATSFTVVSPTSAYSASSASGRTPARLRTGGPLKTVSLVDVAATRAQGKTGSDHDLVTTPKLGRRNIATVTTKPSGGSKPKDSCNNGCIEIAINTDSISATFYVQPSPKAPIVKRRLPRPVILPTNFANYASIPSQMQLAA